MRAFRQTLSPHMHADRELIPSRTEYFSAHGAYKHDPHQDNVAHDHNHSHRDCDPIPRHVVRSTEPIDLTGGQKTRRQRQGNQQAYFFHFTATFLFHILIIPWVCKNVKPLTWISKRVADVPAEYAACPSQKKSRSQQRTAFSFVKRLRKRYLWGTSTRI